ncbi:MAG: DUF3160 domain-containing protein [Muribaculaceae bacterium]|nr:DUF3160 domain-containing protein [Muribaculaceae bacterium]
MMKKIFLLLSVALLTMVSLWAQEEQQPVNLVLPGNGNIDVEKLNGDINLNMDVSRLNLYEIRVLKAAFGARQGELIMQSELRRLFDATSWYTEIAEKRAGLYWDEASGEIIDVALPPITYTPEEQAFIKKLDQAEKDLIANNLMITGTKSHPQKGPNLANLANPMQIKEMPKELENRLANNGFAIVPDEKEQLFHIYENNDYHEFPSFVTTDLYLQTYHMYFDYMLRKMEEGKMLGVMTDYCKQLYTAMMQKAKTSKGNMRAAAQRDAAYFAIAHTLFTGKSSLTVPQKYAAMAQKEIANVKAASSEYSDFLDYKEVKFIYNIYRPRGHYTRSDALQRYFMGMMWLQNAPFGSDKPDQLRAALLIANEIGSSAKFTKIYKSIDEPIAYLMGNPDNLSMLQVYDIMKEDGATITKYMTSAKDLDRVKKKIEAKDEAQTRIRPKFERSSHCKINLMPQRYQPDGEVLQEMVDYDNEPTLRDVPKGLDVFAAMGANGAYRILTEELKENVKWNKYVENMNRMQARMGEIDWSSSVSNMWMQTLKDLTVKDPKMPYFMKNQPWEKKNLNTALASWAELKHDAILYAKQPMGAECGGGGLPEPYVVGYVEPNVAYWSKAIELLDATSKVLTNNNMMTDEMESITTQMREQAQFLLNVSEKELAGTPLTEEEYAKIEKIGSEFEYLTLQIMDAEPGTRWDMGVTGADRNIAVVADVYTANADNNPAKSVLYEAVGPAHSIYVVVEIGGYLYLTRGAVFSYREFQEDIAAPRKTDEEWQQELKAQPNKGIPDWMKEVIVPIGKSLDNEHLFYSSGC